MQTLSETLNSLIALKRLFRLPLAIMVALTATIGALTANPNLSWLLFWTVFWGIFLLSISCSTLNQVQERFTDILISRTCQRPIACGQIDSWTGTVIGIVLGSFGLVLLQLGAGTFSALVGLIAMGWYLLVYTPLKKITPWAVVVGTPCGMLPPLIGWQAASGELCSPQSLSLAMIMLFWQVPHFWLLALPDRVELDLAGFKLLPKTITNQKLLQICLLWILGLASISFMLPLLGLLNTTLSQCVVITWVSIFAFWALRLMYSKIILERAAQQLKLGLYLYLVILLSTLFAQSLFNRLNF